MMKKMIAAGIAALAFAGAAQAASGLQDGTFAEGVNAGLFSTIGTNGAIGDWTVTKGSVDLIGSYWQAPNATGYSLDLNGLTPGAVSQTFTLAAGEYTLSFWLAGNPDGSGTTKSVLVSAGSASQTFTFANSSSTTRNDMGWTLETLTFTTAGSTTLSFASTFGADGSYSPYGAAIGGIAVTAVPEPATLGLLLAGLGMLGVMSSRRRVR